MIYNLIYKKPNFLRLIKPLLVQYPLQVTLLKNHVLIHTHTQRLQYLCMMSSRIYSQDSCRSSTRNFHFFSCGLEASFSLECSPSQPIPPHLVNHFLLMETYHFGPFSLLRGC
uniref:Uncharacterized protein n=1 Tax=Populus davidiana TaxID=266767 RepID=A0A6M2EMP6_9ROSI